MFSGNHKISSRQLYRNYAAGLIALSALFPPLLVNQKNIGSICYAVLFLAAYLAASMVIPRPSSEWVKGVCYVHYWVLGTMLVRMTGLLVQEFLLTDTAMWVILGWFYLFCYYNLYKGLECRIRVSEVLFPFFLFLLFFLSILMYGEVEPERMKELSFSPGVDQVKTGYQLFCWLGAVQSLWHLHGQIQNEKNWRNAVKGIWLTGAVFTLGWSLFTYCIYGNAGHTGLIFPLASAMTLAHFPGNVIGRLDTLFVFAWIIGLFLLCSSLFAPLADGEPDRNRKYLLFALMAASFAFAMNPSCMEWGQNFLYYLSTPLQLLLLLLYGLGKKGRKIITAGLLLPSVLFLSGCSAQELEQQSLVTAIGVDAGEEADFYLTFGFGTADEGGEEPFITEASSIDEAKELYWEYYQKNMDFNHLKTLYFSRELLNKEPFLNMLEEIQIHGDYSRGTLVYVTGSKAGEEAQKEEQPDEGTPVHRLLNAWYNGESCDLPWIAEDGRYKDYISWPYSE